MSRTRWIAQQMQILATNVLLRWPLTVAGKEMWTRVKVTKNLLEMLLLNVVKHIVGNSVDKSESEMWSSCLMLDSKEFAGFSTIDCLNGRPDVVQLKDYESSLILIIICASFVQFCTQFWSTSSINYFYTKYVIIYQKLVYVGTVHVQCDTHEFPINSKPRYMLLKRLWKFIKCSKNYLCTFRILKTLIVVFRLIQNAFKSIRTR